jgi:hypothetical protein
MKLGRTIARGAFVIASAAALGACSQVGSLGGVLGSVLTPQPMSVSATVRSVDTRAQQISLAQTNGSLVSVGYDNNTRVIYQNQNYPVTSLEYGDQVTARVTDQGNNVYYTDSIFVTQPVNGSSSTGGNNTTQSLQGTVRAVDLSNGWFTLDVGNNNTLTVSMPYRASNTDMNKFQSLRAGDFVRLYGIFLNSTRVELQRFY